jgi:AcrR family transcriptional regulator
MKKRFNSEYRKNQILTAARSLFAKKGYSATTLDEIAKKTDISRPRVVQLFGSKLKIYEAIASRAYRSHPLDVDLAEPIRHKDDYGVFKAFAEHVLLHTQKREDRENLKILVAARLREDKFHRVHFHKQDILMVSRLEGYVKERIKDGVFKDMDYRTIIFAYQAMITNLGIYKNVMKKMNFVTIEELSRDCARIFVEGVSCKSDSAKKNISARDRKSGLDRSN